MTRFGTAFIRFVSRQPWYAGAAVVLLGAALFLAGFLARPRENLAQFGGIAAVLLGGVSMLIAFVEPPRRETAEPGLTGPESLAALDLEDFQSVVSGAYGRRGYDIIDDPEHRGPRGVDIRLYKGGRLTLVQTKHWREDITPGMVEELCAAMAEEKAAAGVLVTTAGIGPEPRDKVKGCPIEFMDGPELWRFVNWTGRSL